MALDLALEVIRQFPDKFSHSTILIGSDSQSCLNALQVGPVRKHHPTGLNWSSTWRALLDATLYYDIDFWLLWVPGHVGIEGNELADSEAKQDAALYSETISNDTNYLC